MKIFWKYFRNISKHQVKSAKSSITTRVRHAQTHQLLQEILLLQFCDYSQHQMLNVDRVTDITFLESEQISTL